MSFKIGDMKFDWLKQDFIDSELPVTITGLGKSEVPQNRSNDILGGNLFDKLISYQIQKESAKLSNRQNVFPEKEPPNAPHPRESTDTVNRVLKNDGLPNKTIIFIGVGLVGLVLTAILLVRK